MQILLIGPSGIGKTTLGRYACQHLEDIAFVDLDEQIMRGRPVLDSISQYFKEQGTIRFLDISLKALDEVLYTKRPESNILIAIGAGSITHPRMLNNLKAEHTIGLFPIRPDLLYNRWSLHQDVSLSYYIGHILLPELTVRTLFACDNILLIRGDSVKDDGAKLINKLGSVYGLRMKL